MQSTRPSLGEQVVPHPPGAVGSVAGEEAGADHHAELFIVPAALTARACQPRIEPTRETPSAPHNHSAGQIPRCFATKANFMSTPSRSRLRLFLGCHARPSACSLRA